MTKRFAIAGLAAGLTVGSVAGFALGVPSLVSAQTTTTTTAPDSTTTTPDSTTAPDGNASPGRAQWMDDALAPLVENGTITQAQADAVTDALETARPEGPGGHGHGRIGWGASLEAAAAAIGVTAEDLRAALRSGQSLAEVAAANGVDTQAVIDAIVAEQEAHLAEAVASGDLTQEEADARSATATERITAVVNGEEPAGGRGPGSPGGPGNDGPRNSDDGDSDDGSGS